MMKHIFINNQFLIADRPNILVSDRGLLLGDGLFETIRAYQGKIPFLAAHWARLNQGAQLLDIKIPCTYAEIAAAITELLHRNDLMHQDARIRITLTRGNGPTGLSPAIEFNSTLFITTAHYSLPVPINNLIIATTRRNEFSPLANIKSLNYLDNILALQEAHKKNAEDALLFNTQNQLACATTANVFIVQDNIIFTPPLTDGALPGIMRAIIFKLAQQANIPCKEKSIALNQLKNAEEIFLTNSLMGIRQVKYFQGRASNTHLSEILTTALHKHILLHADNN